MAIGSETESQLISQIKLGDKTAFRQLFDSYYRELLGTAINILRDQDKGKDAVQEVFLQIWKSREALEIRTSVGAYLKRAVINRSLNQIRQAKPFVDQDELADKPSQEDSVLETMAGEELQTALDAALETLPERCRLVFVMKRLEGMSQKEIAKALDISPKTVENQITKAVKVLKVALKMYRNKNPEDG